MRCEVLAVGTELLLGQVIDTNSGEIGKRLAEHGFDSLLATKVGDNLERAVAALCGALDRADAVIVCGGLGPTHDDITRSVLAQVMGVGLVRDDDIAEVIRLMFAKRNRPMPENNLLQADVPLGATIIPQTKGTAPGLICPIDWPRGDPNASPKVIYAVPGVPYEMTDMIERAVVPDLLQRRGHAETIVSRTLRTWGETESGLAERLATTINELDEHGGATIAFLASGIEGIKVRVTAKAASRHEAHAIIDPVVSRLRGELGSLVFGEDDQTMEEVVLDLLGARSSTLALAESMTGGMICERLTRVPGASQVLLGGVVSYATSVKLQLLGVPDGPVVSEIAAKAMATGVRERLGADVGLSITGVAGPSEQDDQPPGTVFVGLAIGDDVSCLALKLFGDRERIRAYGTISALDVLRRTLLAMK